MTSGLVFNLQRFSVHDGPGIRTTVFLQGCPLRCAWCHNPESQDFRPRLLRVETRCMACGACHREAADPAALVEACPTGACRIQGSAWNAEALVKALLKDRLFFDDSGGGVTFSGGEPLCQPRFVQEALERLGAQGVHTALDTCGDVDLGVLLDTARLADLVLYDLKHLEAEAHRTWTGVDNARILANLGHLAQVHPEVWIRVPLVPGVNDAPEHLERLARFVADLGLRRLHLLPYHAIGNLKFDRVGLPCRLRDLQPPDAAQITRASQPFLDHNLELHIGG